MKIDWKSIKNGLRRKIHQILCGKPMSKVIKFQKVFSTFKKRKEHKLFLKLCLGRSLLLSKWYKNENFDI